MFKFEDEEKCKYCQKYNENYNYYVVKSILIELSLAYWGRLLISLGI